MCIVFWYQSDGTDQKLLMSTPTEAEREQQDIDTLRSPDNYSHSETQKVASDDLSGSMLEEDIVSLEALKRYKLIVAANRDEFLDREAEPLHFWNDTDSDIVAGTDTIRGGTWLGLSRKHKCLSIILNKYAEKKPGERRRNSRGKLCVTSLTNQPDFIEKLRSECAEKTYAPFYLLKFDFDEDLKCDYYTCDADGELKHEEIMGTGFTGHSNSSLERPWVKTVKGVQTFKQEVLNSLQRTRNECQVEAIQHLKVQLLKVLQGEKRQGTMIQRWSRTYKGYFLKRHPRTSNCFPLSLPNQNARSTTMALVYTPFSLSTTIMRFTLLSTTASQKTRNISSLIANRNEVETVNR
ncbi:transport and Golgi organization protein 2 homolog isoform X1 [Convolutriloba macropyga]|uniref:transport and Golgi organization protein 2 homolog isoform X1 n=1 Tax=Convolutriloba macropyga TaxID=536237 RepID=UPI003F526778